MNRLEQLERQLEDAHKALRWYASAQSNILKLYADFSDAEPDKDGDMVPRLGKRAREYFDKYPEKVYEPS